MEDIGSPETREEVSDDTEVIETEPPGEPGRDKRTSTVETPEDVDVPEELEAWDSGSERGDDLEPEPDEDEEERQDTGDEERMKNRGGTHARNLLWCSRQLSVRGCAIYLRGRG